MSRNKLFFTVGVVLMLVVFFSYSGNPFSSDRESVSKQAINVVLPTIGSIRDIIVVKGTVAYDHHFVLRAPTSGEVIKLKVKEGDKVLRGQKLLRIEDSQAIIDLDILNIEFKQGKDRLRIAKEEVSAVNALVEAGGMPQYELDQKIRERDVAEQELQRAKLKIDRLKKRMRLFQLESPVEGIVLSVPIKNGLQVSSGEELLSVAGGIGPNIIVFVDAIDAERIYIGQPAILSNHEGSNQKYKGQVEEISKVIADSQRPNSVKVVIEPIAPIPDFRISQQLYVEIVIVEESSVMRIPRELVYPKDNEEVVFVLTEKGVIEKSIVSQPGDITFAKVVSGLTLSDRVVPKPD